jgi:hypothetical protein
VDQVVECMLCKCEALTSNSSNVSKCRSLHQPNLCVSLAKLQHPAFYLHVSVVLLESIFVREVKYRRFSSTIWGCFIQSVKCPYRKNWTFSEEKEFRLWTITSPLSWWSALQIQIWLTSTQNCISQFLEMNLFMPSIYLSVIYHLPMYHLSITSYIIYVPY